MPDLPIYEHSGIPEYDRSVLTLLDLLKAHEIDADHYRRDRGAFLEWTQAAADHAGLVVNNTAVYLRWKNREEPFITNYGSFGRVGSDIAMCQPNQNPKFLRTVAPQVTSHPEYRADAVTADTLRTLWNELYRIDVPGAVETALNSGYGREFLVELRGSDRVDAWRVLWAERERRYRDAIAAVRSQIGNSSETTLRKHPEGPPPSVRQPRSDDRVEVIDDEARIFLGDDMIAVKGASLVTLLRVMADKPGSLRSMKEIREAIGRLMGRTAVDSKGNSFVPLGEVWKASTVISYGKRIRKGLGHHKDLISIGKGGGRWDGPALADRL